MLTTITNYFEYTSQSPIKLVKINLSKPGRYKKLDMTDPELAPSILEEGLTDFWKWNSRHKNLIQNTMCDKLSNSEILNRIAEIWKLDHLIDIYEPMEMDNLEIL